MSKMAASCPVHQEDQAKLNCHRGKHIIYNTITFKSSWFTRLPPFCSELIVEGYLFIHQWF